MNRFVGSCVTNLTRTLEVRDCLTRGEPLEVRDQGFGEPEGSSPFILTNLEPFGEPEGSPTSPRFVVSDKVRHSSSGEPLVRLSGSANLRRTLGEP